MARNYHHACTRCQTEIDPSKLFTKRIEFRRYGFKGSVLRSRTVAWLCRLCMSTDADYNRPTNEVSDGMVQ